MHLVGFIIRMLTTSYETDVVVTSCMNAVILFCNLLHFSLFVCLILAQQSPLGQGLLIREVSRSHTTTHHSR